MQKAVLGEAGMLCPVKARRAGAVKLPLAVVKFYDFLFCFCLLVSDIADDVLSLRVAYISQLFTKTPKPECPSSMDVMSPLQYQS